MGLFCTYAKTQLVRGRVDDAFILLLYWCGISHRTISAAGKPPLRCTFLLPASCLLMDGQGRLLEPYWLPLQILKAAKQQLERLSSNHICNYDNVNWACQGWIISGETVNIPNKAFLSGKHGALKTVISLLMRNTWLTSHPWAWTSLLLTTFLRLSVGHTFRIAGNLTTQIGSLYCGLGLKQRPTHASSCRTNCYFPVSPLFLYL